MKVLPPPCARVLGSALCWTMLIALGVSAGSAAYVGAQSRAVQPSVSYRLRVDSTDRSAFTVEMQIRNATDTLTLAMAAHPEYDDRYWRFVQDLRAESGAGQATIAPLDSALWRVYAPAGETTIRYRVKLPPTEPGSRAAWRPFIESTGALVGGPHSFMYVVGAEGASVHVALDLPPSWQVATGLPSTAMPREFVAPSMDALIESPFLVGQLRTWRFVDRSVPYRVVYWPSQNAVAFDTTAFVNGIRGIVVQAVDLFGSAPWQEYTFLFQDAAYGGLEHPNSVTLGISSAQLAANPHGHLPETAHEFVHAWNLMRIRPAEYQRLTWKTQPPVSVLWFSEGLTLFYADLLARRAGLPTPTPTRIAHLQSLIARYLASPGHSRLSAERVSRAEYNAEPDALGDYVAGSHLQGEIIGSMLDILVRDATDGRRSMDDVMRLMVERFSPERGFMGPDVERAVEDVCGCDVTPLFDAHVRDGSPIDFDRYLALIGLRTTVTWRAALNREQQPAVDLGVWGWVRASDQSLRLRISSPQNIWGRAGLHTGDRVMAVNGQPVSTWPELRAQLVRLRIGDTALIDVQRPAGPFRARVHVTGYQQPVVAIEPLPTATPKAKQLLAAWSASR